MRRTTLTALALTTALSACGYVDKYEEGVYDYEPTYCYAALGGAVTCYRKPVASESRRLVNYYGKSPTRYDPPPPPPEPNYQAPPPIKTWVKDPEPVVKPMVYLPHTSFGQASVRATESLVREANENLTKSIEKDRQERLKKAKQQAGQDGTATESEGAGTSDATSTGASPFR